MQNSGSASAILRSPSAFGAASTTTADATSSSSSSSSSTATTAYRVPSIEFLKGTWHVTHSTLPMWKDKRKVRITYTPLEASSPSIAIEQTDRLDDLVTYEDVRSGKEHTVRGVDKASGEGRDVWDWRGRGWLMIASSHWEVLGWNLGGRDEDTWAVTYFAKTLFTPAGVDIYCRHAEGLREETVQDIKAALAGIEGNEFQDLVKGLFKIGG